MRPFYIEDKRRIMAHKVVDISEFNTISDWEELKKSVDATIVRVGYRGSKSGVITYDAKFKNNIAMLQKYNIPYSGYYFPCSINDEEADEEGDFIIKTIRDYNMKLSLPFYLDSELVDSKKKSGRADRLSKQDRTRYINRILKKLKEAGIPYGVYASTYWYSDHLNDDELINGVSRWVAQYNTVNEYTRYPYDMWQYTSNGNVGGVSGRVDINHCYIDLFENENKEGDGLISDIKEDMKTEEYYINAVIEMAKNEVGYLEKKSNSYLDDKTANAGRNNYTKYWRDIKNWGKGNYQAQYWCAAFIYWCFVKTFGLTSAKALLLHEPYINCHTIATHFRNNGMLYNDPKVGDVVVFMSSNKLYGHTGLVYKVDSDYFYTIEGNTSSTSGVIDNGGAVAYKKYAISYAKRYGHKFCRINYSLLTGEVSSPVETKNYLSIGDSGDAVKEMQKMLIAVGFSCGDAGADGDFGNKTNSALTAFQKAYGLTVDGKYGPKSKAKLEYVYKNKDFLSNGDTGSEVEEMQKMLAVLGYYVGKNGVDGIFGNNTDKAVREFQAKHGLTVDGLYGIKTKAKLEEVYIESTKEDEEEEQPVDESTDDGENIVVGYAKSYKSSYGRTFTTTGDLYMRAGAGIKYAPITVVSKGEKVRCYGYYTMVGNTPWYLVVYGKYKGFMSGAYLK